MTEDHRASANQRRLKVFFVIVLLVAVSLGLSMLVMEFAAP